MIRARLAEEERGWALMTVLLVMAILMSLALPLMTMVDTQQAGTAQERKSEGSFNLAEASLNSTVFLLSSSWPLEDEDAFPEICTPSTTEAGCPDADSIANTYESSDFSALDWTVKVRDDTGSEFYSETAVEELPTWDSNDNGMVWVRSEATAGGRPRVLTALVRMHERVETFPQRVISAGWFATTNTGSKVIVDAWGDAAEPAPLAVRCTTTATSCLGYDPAKGQVSPNRIEVNTSQTAVSPSVLQSFRERAEELGTYYASGCPQTPAGTLVFIENANCTYGSGGADANSADAPGMIVVARGTLTLSGNFEYYGLVYAANLQRSSGAVVTLGGTAEIVGSVAVDYDGGVLAGSSGRNITYSEVVFPEIRSHRTVGIVQGSWREVPPS